jgi:predicted kinase
MAIAHLICGLPGAGKTFFSRQLAQRLPDASRYTPDEWMHRLHSEDPDEAKFTQYYREIEEDIWHRVRKDLRAEKDVILDFGFWTRESRDRARKIVFELGATARLYWLDAPQDILLQRVMLRSQSVPSDSLYIDENAFFEFLGRFEPPEADEQARCISSSSE